ncbi:hypothetical protein [Maritalea sp.]|uniref:hypothetical protein n=1 Tax=Maritalea sp. TaxID=2003361 RepID=UPI003EF6AA38
MKLTAVLWIIIGSMLAGMAVIGVLVAPTLPISDGMAISVAGIVGYLLAIPAAFIIAKKLAI